VVLKATHVFTPNDYPTHTYIKRSGEDLEERLRQASATPKLVVSVSGPSKSGKTVLVERVIGQDNIIAVSGALIKTPDQLWTRVLDWIETPATTTTQLQKTETEQDTETSGLTGKVPTIFEASGQSAFMHSAATTSSETSTVNRSGMMQVVKEIGDSEFLIFVDDFHYMSREVQTEVAKQIKAAAERGIRICVASVPHRADDVVRGNPELRGRTANIDTSFWTKEELIGIAEAGFRALNVEITREEMTAFATEACGSPQLMQAICLWACFLSGISEEQKLKMPLRTDDKRRRLILEATATQCDYSSLVRVMHRGPKIRGTERNQHKFFDKSVGDVYRCVLLALAADPPSTDFPWAELTTRISKVCVDKTPVGSSYREACRQIASFALTMFPTQRIIEWDEESEVETLTIVDPYFLFYLRSSNKLAELGQQQAPASQLSLFR